MSRLLFALAPLSLVIACTTADPVAESPDLPDASEQSAGGGGPGVTDGGDSPAPQAERAFTFVNECPFEVWWAFSGGSTAARNASNQNIDIPCTTNADCPTGSVCATEARPTDAICFWEDPTPSDVDRALSPKPADGPAPSVTVSVPTVSLTGDLSNTAIQWSGSIAARTGCDDTNCTTGLCTLPGGPNNPDGACTPGVGFAPPVTLAEFTLQVAGATGDVAQNDFYDMTVINGMNLPVSMAATAPSGSPFAPAPSNLTDFWCSNPGGTTAANGVDAQACAWNMDSSDNPLPSTLYKRVQAAGAACETDASCSDGQVCGMASGAVQGCGDLIGYWSANEVCGAFYDKPNVPQGLVTGAPFYCDTVVPDEYGDYGTQTTLYQCPATDSDPYNVSCYQNGTSDKPTDQRCCGCTDWTELGIPSSETCTDAGQDRNGPNPFWDGSDPAVPDGGSVLELLTPQKTACPAAYSYPFDDPSSTFQCNTTDTISGANAAGYTITFCPGGETAGVSGM